MGQTTVNTIPVHDLADPRLAPYANMRDAELAQRADPLDPRAHAGLFIAEGELVLRRLLASPFRVHSLLLAPNRVEPLRDALAALPTDVPIFVAEPRVMESIVGFNMHRGVLAIGIRNEGLSVPALLARCHPILVLEDLVNHDNLGGIFRNAAALGGRSIGILLSHRCADPLYRKSLRVSMGSILTVPFARATTPDSGYRDLQVAGFETWALTPHDHALPIAETAKATGGKPVALVLGSEGPGLTDAALAQATRQVRIPMHRVDPVIDSLNVAMAAGIALHVLAESGLTES